jgi:hypothetical protein
LTPDRELAAAAFDCALDVRRFLRIHSFGGALKVTLLGYHAHIREQLRQARDLV